MNDQQPPSIRLFDTPEEEIAALRKHIAFWVEQRDHNPRRAQFKARNIAEAEARIRELEAGTPSERPQEPG